MNRITKLQLAATIRSLVAEGRTYREIDSIVFGLANGNGTRSYRWATKYAVKE